MTPHSLIERITRSLAYMLRHQPEKFDLDLDAYGYAPVHAVVQALNERLGEAVDEEDLTTAVESGDRPRYEIVAGSGGKIRALYGHSIDVEPGSPSKPPEVLYVALAVRDAERALEYGLRGGRRRFLHLALNEDDACETGRRVAEEYMVLQVHALDAWEEGINFYDRQALFLSETIPTAYLEEGEVYDDGAPPQRRDGGRGSDRGGRGGRGGGGRGRGPRREENRDGGRDEARGSDRHSDRGRDREREDERPQRARSEESRPARGGNRDSKRDDRGGDRDERPRRDSRPAAVKSERPSRPEKPAPARPAKKAPAKESDGSGFGLGVFEEKPKKAAPKPRAPKADKPARAKPAPKKAPKEKAEKSDDFGSFGTGV